MKERRNNLRNDLRKDLGNGIRDSLKKGLKNRFENNLINRSGNSLRNQKGEGYIDVVVMVLITMLVMALFVRVYPVFMTKMRLDNFADELIREAEVSGRIGTETTERYERLSEKSGLSPAVTWSQTGNIQLNHEVTVTLTEVVDIGLFGSFASFPITLKSSAMGKSEVYWR